MQYPFLIVGNFLSKSTGIYNVCEEQADKFSKLGWQVLTTSSKKNRFLRLSDMLKTVWCRRYEYAVAQVEVFSGYAFFWAEAVCWALRCVSKPYILILHGGNLPEFALKWPGRVRRLLRSADMVTAPSGYLLNKMHPYCDDIVMIPNPLNLGCYSFHLRKKVHSHLIWLRAFHGVYNPLLAPRILSILADNFPDIKLIMIGPDKGDGSIKQLQTLIESLNLADKIILSGSVPKREVPKWLNKGDIFINTTNFDNTPVSVLEAMASGLCVVSTNVGGIPYLLKDGHDALLVPPEDPKAMASAVRRILTDPGLAERLSANGRKKVEGFDWKHVLPKWERLLISVAEGRKDIK